MNMDSSTQVLMMLAAAAVIYMLFKGGGGSRGSVVASSSTTCIQNAEANLKKAEEKAEANLKKAEAKLKQMNEINKTQYHSDVNRCKEGKLKLGDEGCQDHFNKKYKCNYNKETSENDTCNYKQKMVYTVLENCKNKMDETSEFLLSLMYHTPEEHPYPEDAFMDKIDENLNMFGEKFNPNTCNDKFGEFYNKYIKSGECHQHLDDLDDELYSGQFIVLDE